MDAGVELGDGTSGGTSQACAEAVPADPEVTFITTTNRVCRQWQIHPARGDSALFHWNLGSSTCQRDDGVLQLTK